MRPKLILTPHERATQTSVILLRPHTGFIDKNSTFDIYGGSYPKKFLFSASVVDFKILPMSKVESFHTFSSQDCDRFTFFQMIKHKRPEAHKTFVYAVLSNFAFMRSNEANAEIKHFYNINPRKKDNGGKWQTI